MKINKKIIKLFVMVSWILISTAVLVLLIAAMNIKDKKTCKGLQIEITGVEEFFFLDKQDVRNTISTGFIKEPEGKPVVDFNLQKLEQKLEKNVWVKDAELFFDNNMVLHVHISEREPVARIFTVTGGSFYIDSSAHMMPLSDKMNVRIPVFTGFPTDKSKWKTADSILMQQIKNLAFYILNDEFFRAQIAQVDITADRNFEMIPTLGNHIIDFGSGNNYKDKFGRLKVFYHQVLSHTGFDKYSRINVSYDKQVVGTRSAFTDKIDSMQALKNIQRLIEESGKLAMDTVSTSVDKNITVVKKADSTSSNLMNVKARQNTVIQQKDTVGKSATSESTIQSSSPHLSKKPKNSQVDMRQKPKAVMGKVE